ncbi:MAG TPA: hypothetical protein ENG96_01525 [Gammaproteobacteria bacterium]|nr:hypothetical protein [Gammaproteobacteria bacterium]
MGIGTALWEGFTSFFSIWQICILQISPFVIAFLLGLYLVTLEQKPNASIRQWVVLPYAAYIVGFCLFYSLLIASGLTISRSILYQIGNLRVASGYIILFVALYLILVNRLPFLDKRHNPIVSSVLSLLIGITFAIIYSPCITPTLSDIMGLAAQRGTAIEGWFLAFFYGLGISIALGITAIALILFLRRRQIVRRHARLIAGICGLLVLVPALLNITGQMRHYKAFFLGFLV